MTAVTVRVVVGVMMLWREEWSDLLAVVQRP